MYVQRVSHNRTIPKHQNKHWTSKKL